MLYLVLCFADLIIRFFSGSEKHGENDCITAGKVTAGQLDKTRKSSRDKSRLDPVGMWEPFPVEIWPMTADQVLFGFWDLANKTR
jgi:hypothetical protein